MVILTHRLSGVNRKRAKGVQRMRLIIDGTAKEIADLMSKITKSAEQNDNIDAIMHTKSPVESPIKRTDTETAKKIIQNIQNYAKSLSSSEH